MLEDLDLVEEIEADWITVEVMDKNTGKTYRRTLPIRYHETDNGIELSGETLDGKESRINLLSETALLKIKDLLGKGPDSPKCNDH